MLESHRVKELPTWLEFVQYLIDTPVTRSHLTTTKLCCNDLILIVSDSYHKDLRKISSERTVILYFVIFDIYPL